MPSDPQPVLDAHRFGRTPLPFILGMAACSLVALVSLVIAVQGGPVPGLIGLFLAILPVPVVLAGVLYIDRLEPEPPGRLAVMFGGGAGAAGLLALAGHALGTSVITTPDLEPDATHIHVTLSTAFTGSLLAALLQGAILIALLWSNRGELDGAQDGVVYASMTGLGFALVSNLYAYVTAAHAGVSAIVSEFASRGVLSPLWDPMFTCLIGLGVTYAALQPGRRGFWAIGAGFVAAVALRTLWDDSVSFGLGSLAAVYLVLVIVLLVVMGMVAADYARIFRLINRYLPAYQAEGVVTSYDVMMLTSMRWRRLARQWARFYRGLEGVRAMTDYQLASTELALACDRVDRGLMDAAAFAQRSEDSLTLMRGALAVFREGLPRLHQPPWATLTQSAFLPPAKPKANPPAGAEAS